VKVAVLGSEGQLGLSLKHQQPLDVDVTYYNHKECDITKIIDLKKCLNQHYNFVINASGYTDVEGAEVCPDLAYAINAKGVDLLAMVCAQYNIRLIHISTDFVFDGLSSSPYLITDKTNPINVYGQSKLEGENYVFKHSSYNQVIRTSWLYSPWQNNFVLSIIKLLQNNKYISVVDDEIGSPTSALSLASYIWHQIMHNCFEVSPIVNFCNKGFCTRYQFAKTIAKLAIKYHIILNKVKILPTTAKQLNMLAKRPAYSVLQCDVANNQTWQIELQKIISKLAG